MGVKQCLPLGDSPAASIYSAIHQNKDEVKKRKLKFRVSKDDSGNEYVCRIK